MKRSLLLFGPLLLAACVFVSSDRDGGGRVDVTWDYVSDSHADAGESAGRTPAPEWITLFDGTSLDAFRGYRQEEVPAGWQIVDGALVRVEPAGDLITRGEWGSFELSFEWRIPPGGNSGVMFHVQETDEATWESGPEYQVLDNSVVGPDGDPTTTAAANYALHAPSRDMTNPPGEWNRALLVVDRGHVEHWLNGVRVVSYDLWTDDWERRVAATKFKTRPNYGRSESGHIAFQDHGAQVAYRNMFLLPLDGE